MAAVRVVVSEAAKEDLARQSQWYMSVAGERVASHYLEAFHMSVSVLVPQPAAGTPRKFRDPRLQGLRSVLMPGAFRGISCSTVWRRMPWLSSGYCTA